MTPIAPRRFESPLGSGIDRTMEVLAYGHWGRPVLAFPSEAGKAVDYANNGMVEAVQPLLDQGRIKLYCVDSIDDLSWSNRSLPIEERAVVHRAYTTWLEQAVVPLVAEDCGGTLNLITTGCSMGAYHAVHFAFERADVAPVAIGLSGNYDVRTWRQWGEPGERAYAANPAAFVPQLDGDHLAWLRQQLNLVLVVGQGAWETHPTGSLPSAHQFAPMVADKGIRCELDLWGTDVSHDWEWWRREIAHHLPRFC
ncbi:MAG: esterase [Propionibacteriales bacterium]|nr:esterase [Propionibacteriales bacterium]